MVKTNTSNPEEGSFIKTVTVVAEEEKAQYRIPIPTHVVHLLKIEKGHNFNWYVKRKGNKVSLRAVYMKYSPSQKYIQRPIIRQSALADCVFAYVTHDASGVSRLILERDLYF